MIDREKIIDIFKASPVATVILQADAPHYTIIQANDAALEVLERNAEQLIGKPLFQAFPPSPNNTDGNGQQRLEKAFKKLIHIKEKNEVSNFRHDMVDGDGTYQARYWTIQNSPVLGDDGAVEFIVVVFQDITQNIITEREANLMLHNAADSFVLVGKDHKIINFNEAYSNHCREIIGKPAEKGVSILEYALAERREKAKEILKKVIENGEIVNSELNITSLEGQPLHFKTNYRPAYNEEGNIYGMLLSMYKRTEEVIAKQQLEENEARFRSLVENGSDILMVLKPDGTPSYVSPSVTKTLGYTPEELKGKEVAKVVHPEDVSLIFEELEKCMKQPGEPLKVTPARMRHKDGTYRWFEGTITNMLHDPAIGGIVDNFREITARVAAEEKIRETKEQYQSLVQTIDGIVWESDAQTFEFNYVSPQVQRILGFTEEEWLQADSFWQNHIHPNDRDRVVRYCQEETLQGNNHIFEYRMQHKDGHYLWLRDVVTVIKENGVPVALRGVMMDISEQKALEEKLEQAYELAEIGNWELDVQEEQLNWSRYVKEIHEVGPDFEPDFDSAVHFYKEGWSRQAIQDAVEQAIEKGTPFDLELIIVTAEGNERWIRAVGRAEFQDDTCVRIYGSTQDITDRKRAEQEREFERINKEALINSTDDIIWSIDRKKKLIAANKSFIQRVNNVQNIKMEPGDSIFTGIPEDHEYRNEWETYYDRALNGESFRRETRENDQENGHIIWYETSFNPIYERGEVTGVACYSRNITENKQSQKKLRKAEQKFRNGVEHSTNLFFQHNNEGVLTYVSPQSFDFFGYSPEDSKRKWTDFITDHPVNKAGEKKTLKALETGKAQPPYELQLRKKNGEIIWVKVNEAPLVKNGKVKGMVGSLTDITDQKLYEEQLQDSVERYDYVSKATRDAVYDWDLKKNQLYWGEGFYNQFGYQTKGTEFSIEDWAALVHPNDVEETHQNLNQALEDDSTTNWEYEYRIKKTNGEYAYVVERGYILRDDNGRAVRMIGALRNVTESKTSELKNKLQHELSSHFKQDDDLQSILENVLEHLAGYGHFNTAEIWLTSPDASHQFLGASYAVDEETERFYEYSRAIRKFDYGEGLPGTVWKNNRVETWTNIHQDKAFIRHEAARKSGFKTAIGLPVLHNDNFAGVLLFGSVQEPESHCSTVKLFEVLKEFLGAEIKRKQQEEELMLLFENAPEIIAIASPYGRFTEVNPTFCEILGYTEEEITSQPFENFLHPDDKIATDEEYEETITGKRQAENFLNRYRTKNGDYRWISWYSSPAFGEEGYVFAFGRDVTETKELEELLKQTNRLARVGSWELDIRDDGDDSMYWSEMTREILEVSDEYNPTLTGGFEFYEAESKERIQQAVEKVIETGKPFDEELKVITAKGNARWVRCMGNAEMRDGKCRRIYGSFQDITEKKKAELELEKAFEARKNILESIGDGFYAVDKNWTITYWNKEAEQLLQRNRSEVINKNLWDCFPAAVEMKLYTEYHRALHEHKSLEFEDFFPPLQKWFEISLYPSENGLSVYFKDITERKKAREKLRELNRQLKNRADELAASNAELEQFAYVASHDLQEPLRMVSSFLTQLDKKYSDQLDEKANQYIYYAVDGAQRMRQIILDLLNYSRLNSDSTDFEVQNLNKLLEEVKSIERSNIEESEAIIEVDALPTMEVNAGAIKQLFQNLISNAIKYSNEGTAPRIKIEAEELDSHWKFSCSDNGIGINPEFKDSIFQIFQRLHTRDEYSGTGIGLAISKKIVERHGGEIWVESEEGKGSTFYFTLSKNISPKKPKV